MRLEEFMIRFLGSLFIIHEELIVRRFAYNRLDNLIGYNTCWCVVVRAIDEQRRPKNFVRKTKETYSRYRS